MAATLSIIGFLNRISAIPCVPAGPIEKALSKRGWKVNGDDSKHGDYGRWSLISMTPLCGRILGSLTSLPDLALADIVFTRDSGIDTMAFPN